MKESSPTEREWTTVIKPKDKLLNVDFSELWRYRDLMMLFVKRNIITQYKQTVLGPLWYLIQPMMTTIMYMVVFGGIAKISCLYSSSERGDRTDPARLRAPADFLFPGRYRRREARNGLDARSRTYRSENARPALSLPVSDAGFAR